MLSLLSQDHDVEVLYPVESLHQDRPTKPHLPQLWRLPNSVKLHPCQAEVPTLWNRSLERILPDVIHGDSEELKRAIETFAKAIKKAGGLPRVWVSRLRTAQYVKLAKSLGFHVTLDEHQVECDVMLEDAFSSWRGLSSTFHAIETWLLERRVAQSVDQLISSTEIDASRLRKLASNLPISVFGLALPMEPEWIPKSQSNQEACPTLLMVGSLHYPPFLEGIRWCIREILPRIERASAASESPMPKLLIAGTDPDPANPVYREISELCEVQIIESRADLRACFDRAHVALFPLRKGRGNRWLLLETLAAGIPTVTQGRAADGVLFDPGVTGFLAEKPDTFTSYILRLLRDADLRLKVGQASRKLIQERYSLGETQVRALRALFTTPK
jgi:glycosyltransferase involved in cell wall biosynthesis